MDSGLILIITLSIPFLILIGFYTWLSKRKKIHTETLKSDWIKFEKAINRKHISSIIKYGTDLIYNENLTDYQLKKMKNEVDLLLKKYSQLETLNNLIYNKRLHWNSN